MLFRSSDVPPEKAPDERSDLRRMGLEREMAGIAEVDLPVGKIALVGLRTGRNEGRIMPAPHGEKRRLVLAEIRLELRVAGDIAGVIPDQVKLDLFRTGPRHQGNVEHVSVRAK